MACKDIMHYENFDHELGKLLQVDNNSANDKHKLEFMYKIIKSV